MNIKHEPIHRKYRQRDRPMTLWDWCYVGVALAVLFLIGIAAV